MKKYWHNFDSYISPERGTKAPLSTYTSSANLFPSSSSPVSFSSVSLGDLDLSLPSISIFFGGGGGRSGGLADLPAKDETFWAIGTNDRDEQMMLWITGMFKPKLCMEKASGIRRNPFFAPLPLGTRRDRGWRRQPSWRRFRRRVRRGRSREQIPHRRRPRRRRSRRRRGRRCCWSRRSFLRLHRGRGRPRREWPPQRPVLQYPAK